MTPKNGLQRQLQAPGQPAGHALGVERDVHQPPLGKSSGSAPVSGRMPL